MRKVLIIGHTGYIGSALLEHMSSNNYEISTWSKQENYSCYSSIRRAALTDLDAIVLLAGNSSVARCKDIKTTFDNNVTNFISFVDKLPNTVKLLYASSASVYGNTSYYGGLSREDDDLSIPVNPYDLSKQVIDYAISMSNHQNWIGMRFATVNGAYSSKTNLRTDLMINRMYKSYINRGYIEVANPSDCRPILDIRDLCFTINTLINSDYSGYINMCSGNYRIGDISSKVGEVLSCPVKDISIPNSYSFTLSRSLHSDYLNRTRSIKDTVESLKQVPLDVWKDTTGKYERV